MSEVTVRQLRNRGGRLEAQDVGGCHIRVRLRVKTGLGNPMTARLMNQVQGEREFSSGRSAMQAVNPTVYELFIQYDRMPANLRMEQARESRHDKRCLLTGVPVTEREGRPHEA